MNQLIRALPIWGALIGLSVCGCDDKKSDPTTATPATPSAEKQAATPRAEPVRPAPVKPPAKPSPFSAVELEAIAFAEADFRSHWGPIDNTAWDPATASDWKVESSAVDPGKKTFTQAVPGTWATKTPEPKFITGKDITCTVTVLPVSEADKAKGTKWHGVVQYRAAAWRDWSKPKQVWRDGPGSFTFFTRDIVYSDSKWSGKPLLGKGNGDFSTGTAAAAADLPK